MKTFENFTNNNIIINFINNISTNEKYADNITISKIKKDYDLTRIEKMLKKILMSEHNTNLYQAFIENISITKEEYLKWDNEYERENIIELFNNKENNQLDFYSDLMKILDDWKFDFIEFIMKDKKWTDIVDLQYYYNIIDNLSDKIKVYRNIVIDNDTLNEYKCIGEYWSLKSDTEAYHNQKNNGLEIILIGIIDIRNVNWYNTIYKSLYNINYEEEIELISDFTIDIIGYNDNDKNILLKNKKTVII